MGVFFKFKFILYIDYNYVKYYSPLHKSVKTEMFSLSLDLGVAVVWHQIRDHVTPACD